MNMKPVLLLAAVTAISRTALPDAVAADSSPERIGVYDSRVLAYAHFWSEAEQASLNKAFVEAREAKAKGDTNRLSQLKAEMKARQEKNHLQVFSTAPADEVLASIKDRVTLVQKQARVSQLVSKWDEALKQHPSAEQVDVTDQLLGAFKLDQKQAKVVAEIRKQEPLPLAKARESLREGKL